MKYNGIEITEFKGDKLQLFDPPKKMLVWNDGYDEPYKTAVYAFIPNRCHSVICSNGQDFMHCAEIPNLTK